MIPAPVLFAYVAVAGWPSLKLCSALATRAIRRRVLKAKAALDANSHYGAADRHIINDTMTQAYPGYVVATSPFMIVAMIMLYIFWPSKLKEINSASDFAIEEYRKSVVEFYKSNGHPELEISFFLDKDKSFRRMDNYMFVIQLLKAPVASVFTGLLGSILWLPIKMFRDFQSPRSVLKKIVRIGLEATSHKGFGSTVFHA